MPGQWLTGLQVGVVQVEKIPEAVPEGLARSLDQDSLVGARVLDGTAAILTDFRLNADGFGRWIVLTTQPDPVLLGRLVQRLLELEEYRMTALLGLPMAREVTISLATAERDLAEIAEQITTASVTEEPELLHRLTDLAARIEGLYARTHSRFSASEAYFDIVGRRMSDLEEQRWDGLQTVAEFLGRRLAPAKRTCSWAARRQKALSERVSRVSDLLRTRVEIEAEQSSRGLLDTMNRRQKAQFLLQSAVEGLSVAAITYYGVGLVGYLAKGLKVLNVELSPELVTAAAVPLVAVVVWFGIRRLHHRLAAHAE